VSELERNIALLTGASSGMSRPSQGGADLHTGNTVHATSRRGPHARVAGQRVESGPW
jgi:NADP-dependent 3-hydroxy acid dehydrogenase YdfG